MTTRDFPQSLAFVTFSAHGTGILEKRANGIQIVAPSWMFYGKKNGLHKHSHGSGLVFLVALL